MSKSKPFEIGLPFLTFDKRGFYSVSDDRTGTVFVDLNYRFSTTFECGTFQ